MASIADQGAAAAISFVASVFIGRHMGAEALGIYAITNVFVILIRAFQNSLVLEPMSVFGAKKSVQEMPTYFGFLLAMEGATVGGSTLLLALGSAAAYGAGYIERNLLYALLAAAVYANLLCFQYFLRRQFYIEQRQYLATIQSVTYLVLVIAGLAAMWWLSDLSVVDVYVLLSISSLGVCVVQGGRFWQRLARPARDDVSRYREDHWTYGRWVLLGVPLAILTYQGYFFIVGALISAEAAGHLKAVDTLVAPFAQVAIGLSLMLVPMTSRGIGSMSLRAQQVHAIRMGLPLLGLSVIYGGAIFLGGEYALKALFGSGIEEALSLVQIMAFVPFLRALPQPAGIVLSALQRSNLRFFSQVLAAIGTFAVSIPLVLAYGLTGAAWGMLISLGLFALSQWACLLWLWRRMARKQSQPIAAQPSES
ncbi:MAG TPA: hypothetical protein PK694_01115 [Rhodospirillales bacterium]|nr:hypothetical protein [Rhodospirillales bacterium]